jgi:hypothetical protein
MGIEVHTQACGHESSNAGIGYAKCKDGHRREKCEQTEAREHANC